MYKFRESYFKLDKTKFSQFIGDMYFDDAWVVINRNSFEDKITAKTCVFEAEQ